MPQNDVWHTMTNAQRSVGLFCSITASHRRNSSTELHCSNKNPERRGGDDYHEERIVWSNSTSGSSCRAARLSRDRSIGDILRANPGRHLSGSGATIGSPATPRATSSRLTTATSELPRPNPIRPLESGRGAAVASRAAESSTISADRPGVDQCTSA